MTLPEIVEERPGTNDRWQAQLLSDTCCKAVGQSRTDISLSAHSLQEHDPALGQLAQQPLMALEIGEDSGPESQPTCPFWAESTQPGFLSSSLFVLKLPCEFLPSNGAYVSCVFLTSAIASHTLANADRLGVGVMVWPRSHRLYIITTLLAPLLLLPGSEKKIPVQCSDGPITGTKAPRVRYCRSRCSSAARDLPIANYCELPQELENLCKQQSIEGLTFTWATGKKALSSLWLQR